MILAHTVTAHDVSPEDAVQALRAFDGPLLLDLDETLYLRNSTEDFIDTARPGNAAAVLMKLLDWIKPWRWTGGATTRDTWRVRLVIILFPWTIRLWRRRAPQLVEEYANDSLVAALRSHACPPTIVTMGFYPIVSPLIAAFNLGETRIVAVRPSSFEDRQRGKLNLVVNAMGEDAVHRGLVITDSTDDLPLLNACARPLRTVWPGALNRNALSDIYLPGLYLSRIKRPGERYFIRGILQEDFAFWLLCSIGLAAFPILHVVGLLFLLLSFWTIYERGYVDNDNIAAHFESKPKLSSNFHDAPVATPRVAPWIWASALGAIAILFLRWPEPATLNDFARWMAVLLITHGWFLLYNRFDKQTRVWLYSGLQVARSTAFVIVVPVAAIGTVALSAHVLAKWLPYYVYRFGGKDWPETPQPLTRLVFFVVLSILLVVTQGAQAVTTWTAAALLAWNIFRARDELRTTIRSSHRIDRFTL